MPNHLASNSTFAVITGGVETDIAWEANGPLSISMVDDCGDMISVDFELVEARALRDWLVKVIPDA